MRNQKLFSEMQCAFLFSVILLSATAIADEGPEKKQSRKFNLSYGAKILDAPVGAEVKVWIPLAQPSPLQKIDIVESKTPGPLQVNNDARYGNRIGFFQINSEKQPVEFLLKYRIERKEAKPGLVKEELSENQKREYLKANQLVPITGKPIELLNNQRLPAGNLQLGQRLYDIVEAYMTYDKSKPGYGNGDVLWACSSQTGNCTDFHSLFISLARSQNLPAKFEIGFPIPTDKTSGSIGGYHCWAWFYTGEQGWIAVDISEADKHPELKEYYFGRLTPDRVAFSVGRDIELVPESSSEKLNYFVYPHVEVNGKKWPKDKIKMTLEFENQKRN